MQNWRETLIQPFIKQIDKQHQVIATARPLVEDGEKKTAHWPQMEEIIRRVAIPRLKGRRVELRKRKSRRVPLLRTLRRERKKTAQFTRTFWLRPQAVYLRLQIRILEQKVNLLRELSRQDTATDSPPDDITSGADERNERTNGPDE